MAVGAGGAGAGGTGEVESFIFLNSRRWKGTKIWTGPVSSLVMPPGLELLGGALDQPFGLITRPMESEFAFSRCFAKGS